MVLLSMGGIILAAAYMLWTLQRVALGPTTSRMAASLPDLNPRELVTVIPLAVLIFLIGLYPTPMFNVMDASVNYLVNQMENAPALQLSEGVAPVIRESIGH